MPDERGFLLAEEKQVLLRHFAPVLVLFPETPASAPYPDEGDAIYTVRGSYHPRAVEMFLELARVRYKRSVLLRQPGLIFARRRYTQELARARAGITPGDVEAAVEKYRTDPRYAGMSQQALIEAVHDRLVQEELSKRLHGLDLPLHRARNLKFWKAYFRYLNKLGPQVCRSVVYGRVLQGLAPLNAEIAPPTDPSKPPRASFGPVDVSRARVALQYWFHYLYDDWANRHEGDLESMTVLVSLDESLVLRARPLTAEELLGGVTPLEVGYSAHEDGFRRCWSDVQKTREGRPILYVARGSSASYFEWRLEGFPASARVGFVEKVLTVPGMFIGARRFLGRRWDTAYFARFTARGPQNTDWVAADPQPEDRSDQSPANAQERQIPCECRGVRRLPAFDEQAGLDDHTYYLETDRLFWIEMAQEYGLQWGQDSLFPGTQGPRGQTKAERDKKVAQVDQLVRLEVLIEEALTVIDRDLRKLSERRLAINNAIPQLEDALRPLRPAQLRAKGAFPTSARNFVYTMWAWILKVHPEAWPGGPGLLNQWRFARQLRPGIFSIFTWRGRAQPLLDRQDPLYHIKTLLARVRQMRYEMQLIESKWDNPFSWVRYTCLADSFFYGRRQRQTLTPADLQLIDCEDSPLSMR